MPFRSWCPFCIKGRAGAAWHRKREEASGNVPVISIDYAFMGRGMEEDEESGNPILVMKDRRSKAVMAHMMPRKGTDPYAIESEA